MSHMGTRGYQANLLRSCNFERPPTGGVACYVEDRAAPRSSALGGKGAWVPPTPPETVNYRALSCTPFLNALREKGIWTGVVKRLVTK
jgi:hypothetical protein